MVEQRFAPLSELGGGDTGTGLGALFHHLLIIAELVSGEAAEPTSRARGGDGTAFAAFAALDLHAVKARSRSDERG